MVVFRLTPPFTGYYTGVVIAVLIVKLITSTVDYLMGKYIRGYNTLDAEKRNGVVWHFTKSFCQMCLFAVWCKVLFNTLILQEISAFPDQNTFDWIIAVGAGTVGVYLVEIVWKSNVTSFSIIHHIVFILMTCIGYESFLFPGIRQDAVACKLAYIYGCLSMIFFPTNLSLVFYRFMTRESHLLHLIMKVIVTYEFIFRTLVQIVLVLYFVFFNHLMKEQSRILWIIAFPLYGMSEAYSPYVMFTIYRKLPPQNVSQNNNTENQYSSMEASDLNTFATDDEGTALRVSFFSFILTLFMIFKEICNESKEMGNEMVPIPIIFDDSE